MSDSIFIQGMKNDHKRSGAFKNAYGLDVECDFLSYFDLKGNSTRFEIEFRDKNGSKYFLNETYKHGDDNSTDHVELIYKDCRKIFSKYVDAEIAVADLIRENLAGNAVL